MTDKTMDLSIKGRLGMVIDGTGRDYDKIANQKALLQQLGYDCYMIFVNTSLEVALERNKRRERSVPEYITRKSHAIVQGNIGKFQNTFGMGNMIIIDNSKDERELTTQIMNRCLKTVSRLLRNKIKSYTQKDGRYRKKIKKKMKTFWWKPVIDIPRRTYAKGVFDDADTNNPKIKDSVKAQIDKQIEEFETEYPVVKIGLIGLILTKRYRDDADLILMYCLMYQLKKEKTKD